MKTIKLLALLSVFLSIALSMKAQLKVNDQGKVGVGFLQSAQSQLAVGAPGNSSTLSYFQSTGTSMLINNLGTTSTSQWGTGLKIDGMITSPLGDVGLESSVYSTYAKSGHSIGVLGIAGNGSGGYNRKD